MTPPYSIRPQADADINQQSEYLWEQAGSEVAHRFLVAAHETFALLARRPPEPGAVTHRSDLATCTISRIAELTPSCHNRFALASLRRVVGYVHLTRTDCR